MWRSRCRKSGRCPDEIATLRSQCRPGRNWVRVRYQLLITADQRIPYQQNLSRRSIAVLIITSNERQAVSNAVAVINDAVNSMAAGETHVLHIHAT